MRSMLNRLQSILSSAWAAPAALLLVCVAAYAPGITHMGFYWDDWPMNWIAQNMGNPGLAQYFSTNRPVWGLLYQLTTPLLGGTPLAWQIAALAGRFLTGLLAWALVVEVWPRQRGAALATGLLFVVYPGFMQQHVALLYTHFYLVICFWLGSLLCTAAALRRSRQQMWLLSGLAVALGLANLVMMEYFFLLELLRPLLIFIIAGQETAASFRNRLWRSIKLWAPYLLMFAAAGVWRVFLFPYTQNNYKLNFVEQLKSGPLQAIGGLLNIILTQNKMVTFDAWAQVFNRPQAQDVLGVPGGTRGYWLILALCAAAIFLALWGQKDEPQPWRALRRRWGWAALALGLVSLLLAGWPFWLTDVPFRLEFAFDRFTLPFMLGVSLIMAGLLDLIPLWRPLKLAALAGLVALGVGWQIQVGASFMRDWQVEQTFFQELPWRAPALQPGTAVIVNALRIRPTDNSLSAALNWIYAPGDPHQALQYQLIYPTLRLGSDALPALEKGQALFKDYLVGLFQGSTDRAIALYYSPDACLRLLTPADAADPGLPDAVLKTAALSDPGLVHLPGKDRGQQALIPGILPATPDGASWCQTYEQAALAAQYDSWQKAAALGDSAGDLASLAQTPSELFPFIEAYAHAGNWDKATRLSLQVLKTDSAFQPQVCQIWGRVEKSLPSTQPLTSVIASVGCNSKGSS